MKPELDEMWEPIFNIGQRKSAMIKMTIDNSDEVLNNIKEMIKGEKRDARILIKALNNMLDDLLAEDFFGTEGQSDPRGDWRDDE